MKSTMRIVLAAVILAIAAAAGAQTDQTAGRDTKPATPAAPELLTTRVGSIKLKRIPAGTFLMGSPDDDKDAHRNQKPQHFVGITSPFYLGVYEVTQAQYQAVKGNNPSYFSAIGKAKDVVAGQSVGELEATRFVEDVGSPPAARRLAGRAGHVVPRLAADDEVVGRAVLHLQPVPRSAAGLVHDDRGRGGDGDLRGPDRPPVRARDPVDRDQEPAVERLR